METANDRIKRIRTDLQLSQDDFGNAIGLSKSGISNIENGASAVREIHIKVICFTFGVSEEWLKTGEGESCAVRNVPLSKYSTVELMDELKRRCSDE